MLLKRSCKSASKWVGVLSYVPNVHSFVELMLALRHHPAISSKFALVLMQNPVFDWSIHNYHNHFILTSTSPAWWIQAPFLTLVGVSRSMGICSTSRWNCLKRACTSLKLPLCWSVCTCGKYSARSHTITHLRSDHLTDGTPLSASSFSFPALCNS